MRLRARLQTGAVAFMLAISLVLPVVVPSGPASALDFAFGDGSVEDPFLIHDCEELQAINQDLGAHYELANTIDCAQTEDWNEGLGFTPIGDLFEDEGPFGGSLDGQGYAINNLHIDRFSYSPNPVGLFGTIFGGEVRNLDISGEITGHNMVGGITGVLGFGTIENVNSTQLVGGSPTDDLPLPFTGVGGIVGIITGDALVSRSSSQGIVVGYWEEDLPFNVVGGLIGLFIDGGELSDSYSTAVVAAATPGLTILGGAVGAQLVFGSGSPDPSLITRTYAAAQVIAQDENMAGGFAGALQNTYLSDNFSVSTITGGDDAQTGGFAVMGMGDVLLERNYLDVGRSGFPSCDASEEPVVGCEVINTDEAPAPNYFFNNQINPPLDRWDFADTWVMQSSDFPLLNRTMVSDPTPDPDPDEPTDDDDEPSLPEFTAGSGDWVSPFAYQPPTDDDPDSDEGEESDDTIDTATPATPDQTTPTIAQAGWSIVGIILWIIAGVVVLVLIGLGIRRALSSRN